jgi:hypothetical protein
MVTLFAVVLKLLRKVFHLSHRGKTKRKIWEVAVVAVLADGGGGRGRGVTKNKRQHETWPLVIFIFSVPCPERFIDIVKISLALAAFLLVVYTVKCMWVMLKCIVAGLVSPVNTREIFAQ